MESESTAEEPAQPRWQPDAIMLLVALILVGFSLGGIVLWGLERLGIGRNQDPRFLRFAAGSLCLQGLGLIYIHVFLRWHGVRWRDFLGLDTRKAIAVPAIVTAIFAIPATMVLNRLSAWLIEFFQEPIPQAVLAVVRENTAGWQQAVFFIAVAGLAPVFEEALFRGILYRAMKQMGHPVLAWVGSSLLFGASHATLVTLLPLTFLGMVLARLYDRTEGLLAPILVHSLFNAVNLSILMLMSGRTSVGG